MLLKREEFLQAFEFVKNNARELDRKLIESQFGNESEKEVRKALVKYQNPDGGFGNAIDPDFRLKASSPMATSVGLQYCTQIELDSADPIIESAMKYLVSTYQSDGGYWPPTFMNVNEEPHAPWWHVESVISPSEAGWPNPNAELVGYMNKYAIHVPKDVLIAVNRRALLNLESSTYIEGLIYDIVCWNRAYSYLPDALRRKATDKIERTLRKIMPTIEQVLREVRVFVIAPDPQSLLYRLYPDRVTGLIASQIQKQSDDGGWWPTWEWGQYMDSWSHAKKEWAGKITVECLISLKQYNFIEMIS
ncbi:MAG: hypothetical protein C4K48_12750 [Candidatus Thorarchaeota archaeon]|nr:MAG: hypothetical protein C4K48_12750 [Candidatus Thorarchaeota archaeon]